MPTINDLGRLFRQHHVPDYYYVLDGSLGPGECYGIEESNGDWVIYYSERGSKRELKRLRTEAAACVCMIEYINETMRSQFGRSIPLPPR